MKHVELIGVAGSGKSTVAETLQSRNPAIQSLTDLHGTVVTELLFPGPSSRLGARLSPRVLSYLARASGLSDRAVNFFSLTYPEMLSQTAHYTREYTDDPSRIEYVSGSTLDLVEQFGAVEEHSGLLWDDSAGRDSTAPPSDGPVLLVDEGFAFTAASVVHPPQHSRQFAPEDLRDYISTLPVPDAIVFVRASPDVCVSRMRKRQSGVPASWEHLDVDSLVDFAAEAETVAETIAEAFAARGTRIVEVETDNRPVERSVADVRRELAGSPLL